MRDERKTIAQCDFNRESKSSLTNNKILIPSTEGQLVAALGINRMFFEKDKEIL